MYIIYKIQKYSIKNTAILNSCTGTCIYCYGELRDDCRRRLPRGRKCDFTVLLRRILLWQRLATLPPSVCSRWLRRGRSSPWRCSRSVARCKWHRWSGFLWKWCRRHDSSFVVLHVVLVCDGARRVDDHRQAEAATVFAKKNILECMSRGNAGEWEKCDVFARRQKSGRVFHS